jgi:hypothetical protein
MDQMTQGPIQLKGSDDGVLHAQHLFYLCPVYQHDIPSTVYALIVLHGVSPSLRAFGIGVTGYYSCSVCSGLLLRLVC